LPSKQTKVYVAERTLLSGRVLQIIVVFYYNIVKLLPVKFEVKYIKDSFLVCLSGLLKSKFILLAQKWLTN
jgi:hypothetical protein